MSTGKQKVEGDRPANPYPGGEKKPKVDLADIKDRPTIATIEALRWANFSKDGEEDDAYKLVVIFAEWPGKEHVLNKTQYKQLVSVFGENEESWIGKRVPLKPESVRDPSAGKQVRKVWVATPQEEWDAIMARSKRK